MDQSVLRVLKLKGFREAVASGGPATQGVLNSLKLNNYYQSIEGMSLIDAEDNLEIHGHQAFGGLAEALVHFGQQLSGALQIPLVRLFGQSPAGLNSSGESDLKTYYDGIRNLQMRMLKTGALKIYRCCAASIGIQLPDDFDLSFKSLWQMTEPEKAQVAAQDSATVVAVWQSGLIKAAVALMELKQLSRLTGRFTNITDEVIAEAESEPPAAPGGAAKDHLSTAWDEEWREDDHPRGYHGRFVEKTGASGSPPPPNGPEPSPAAPPTASPSPAPDWVLQWNALSENGYKPNAPNENGVHANTPNVAAPPPLPPAFVSTVVAPIVAAIAQTAAGQRAFTERTGIPAGFGLGPDTASVAVSPYYRVLGRLLANPPVPQALAMALFDIPGAGPGAGLAGATNGLVRAGQSGSQASPLARRWHQAPRCFRRMLAPQTEQVAEVGGGPHHDRNRLPRLRRSRQIRTLSLVVPPTPNVCSKHR